MGLIGSAIGAAGSIFGGIKASKACLLYTSVQEGKLWFLQTRNGKRTGAAMVKIAMDLLRQGMIDEKTCLLYTS